MTRKYQRPTVKKNGSRGTKYSHPAYGMISASRVQGTTYLFGSEFSHHGFIAVKIGRGSRIRDLNSDWYHMSDEIVEVYLSYAQWVEFLTTMNVGSGVPCTIDFLKGEGFMPGVPPSEFEQEFHDELKKDLRDIYYGAKEALEEAERLLEESKPPSKAKREKLRDIIYKLEQNLRANLPFLKTQYEKAWERTRAKAKSEIEAHITNLISRLGSKALQDMTKEELLMLTAKKDENVL